MMYKEQIKEQMDDIRKFMRVLERRYRALKTDEAFDELMFYKAKFDSWKRLYEKAPHMVTNVGVVTIYHERIIPRSTLADIMEKARGPHDVQVTDRPEYLGD